LAPMLLLEDCAFVMDCHVQNFSMQLKT